MKLLDWMRLAPLALLVALAFAFQCAMLRSAPDLDVFPAAKDQKKAVICTQLGCPPCAAMKKEIVGKKFPFEIEWASTREKKWAVKAAPTTIKLVAEKEVDRKVGFQSAADLTAWMAK
jgi:hypothetical protein